MMVGIAGGLKDVQLGDVVVGDKIYHYESAKDTDRGRLSRIDIAEPAHRLVHRARAVARSTNWIARIKGSQRRPSPTAIVGPIAAGEKVVAGRKSTTFALLRRDFSDAVAVEMEGYGVLRATHANEVRGIVVRGISDLIDEKAKSDATGSQDVASRHAAAFAFQLLADLTPDSQFITRRPDDATKRSDASTRRTFPSRVWNVPYARNPHFGVPRIQWRFVNDASVLPRIARD